MRFSVRPYRRFTMFCAQLISQDCLRGCKQAAYIILILVLAGCVGRNGDSPPLSQQAECISGTIGSCFFWKETSSKTNEKLIIFVHGVFSTSANTWGEVKAGNTWPELVRGDDNFKDYDIYLVNYRTTYVTSAPNIYQVAKRELERLKDKGIFKQYKEIYFIAHSMGGLVAKNLLKQLNRKEDEPLLRQVRGVVYLGTPSQGVDAATLAKWLSFNPQLVAMEPARLNQWISELEDEWIRLMDERGESQYPRAFCAYEIRSYLPGYVVVPREAAYSRCDTFTGLDLDHSDLAVPRRRDNDQYEWAMHRIDETSKGVNGQSLLTKQNTPAYKKPPAEMLAPAARAVATASIVEACGPSPLTLRTPEEFFSHWDAQVEKFRHRNDQFQDLGYLTESNIPREAGPHPGQWHHEATYTLRCLEKKGKLKIEMVDPPRNKYRGEFENLKFVFPK